MPPHDSIMPFQSDSRATGIAEYAAIFIPCYHQNQLRVAIRSFERDGHGYFLLADPYMLTTHVVLKSDIQHRKPSVGPNDSAYYHKADLDNTPYGMTLKRVQQSTHPTENDGITHSLCNHRLHQVFLTIDLCPSNKCFEQAFFEALATLATAKKPVPIALCITEFWRTLHLNEFNWFLEKQRIGLFNITWVNHSTSHVYYHDCITPQALHDNFLLDPRTNLTYELFEIEKSLLMHGELPSIFFRAPGLVTNQALINAVDKVGLITLGADAWLAKGQQAVSGSFILVHGNGNEPAGIDIMMDLLAKKSLEFLPLQHAFHALSRK